MEVSYQYILEVTPQQIAMWVIGGILIFWPSKGRWSRRSFCRWALAQSLSICPSPSRKR